MKTKGRNKSKVMSLLLVMSLILGLLVAPEGKISAESIPDYAKELGNSETVTCFPSILKKTAYKIELTQAGTMKFAINSKRKNLNLYLYDSDDKIVEDYSDLKTTQGFAFEQGDYCSFYWNETTQTIKGSVSYKLSAGTYYLDICTSYATGVKETKLTTSWSTTMSASKVAIELEMPVGSTIKLNALLTPSNSTSKVTWKSSKKSICSVSDTGKVKAVAKGNCKIYAVANGHETKIQIKVVD